MSSSTRSVVIHGHFYQPPREDPWFGTVEEQPSAAPYHDWNARLEAECYRTVVAARIPGREGRIQEILNTLQYISFNFGGTLLEWMEKEAPRTYREILEADRLSRIARGGHGNAIAQAYHHSILPLASRRDKITEVRWGVLDFRHRFRRDPVGMWLPETAVDAETLDVLAQEGIVFTIVAPHQVDPLPRGGLPGLYRTQGGRTIALFVYDGALSHDVAFGPLLKDAGAWADRLMGEVPTNSSENPPPRLVSIATDGETYGHHHRFGEMALAAAIKAIRSRPGVSLENFSGFLHHSPPVEEVSLVEPTSWSCAHGIERWRADCGCKMDPREETQQAWRSGLRDAMDQLATNIHEIYESETSDFFDDPWEVRNDYGQVVVGWESPEEFFHRTLPPSFGAEERIRAAEFLEMERTALRIFTSCGWFFDDLAGIEPLQILRYAARALELAGLLGTSLEDGFLRLLATVSSNEAIPRDGASIFLEEIRPEIPAYVRVAAGAMALIRRGQALPDLPGFRIDPQDGQNMAVFQKITGRRFLVEVEMEEEARWEIRFRVRERTGEGGGPSLQEREHRFGVEDLPETFRVPLDDSFIQEVLELRALDGTGSTPQVDTACSGSLLSDTLTSAVRELREQDASFIPAPTSLEQIEGLARLLTRRGFPVPFDAQTEFNRVLTSASSNRAAALHHLGELLGFVMDR